MGCPPDNGNSQCSDSPEWHDTKGNNCAWYTKNDHGCSIYANEGQRQHCKKSCKTCEAPGLQPGEVCGFFRILRGENHCGVEQSAAYAFSSLYSSSQELEEGTSSPQCQGRLDWN